VTGRPIAISDDAMAELFLFARPLDPRDRTLFVEDVVAELDVHAEIDIGLVHRVAGSVQRRYLGFARGVGRAQRPSGGLLKGVAMAWRSCGPVALHGHRCAA
jgi:hypothetical protein